MSDWKYVIKPEALDAAGKVRAEVAIAYGTFIQTLIDFVIIAFVIFLVIKAYNRMRARPMPLLRHRRPKKCCCCARSATQSNASSTLTGARRRDEVTVVWPSTARCTTSGIAQALSRTSPQRAAARRDPTGA